MKQTIDKSLFVQAFENYKRVGADGFSYAALNRLWDYFEEIESETDTEMELDVIAICCDWSEEPLTDVLRSYDLEDLEELRDRTTVLEVDDATVVYLVF